MALNSLNRPMIRGKLDSLSEDGVLKGWCWSPDFPATRRNVVVWVDGVAVLTVDCDQFRDDLRSAGIGDGAHAFEAQIPAGIGMDKKSHSISLQDLETVQIVGEALITEDHQEFDVYIKSRDEPSDANPLKAYIDDITEDGVVTGWCWDPTEPQRRVELTLFADSVPVGSTVARLFREDLKEAGIGDGAHCFTFVIPWSAFADRTSVRVSIRDTLSGFTVGNSPVWQRRSLATVSERLQELERKVRLIQHRVDEALRSPGSRAEPSIVELFTTVGGFFMQMAESMQKGASGRLVPRLSTMVSEITTRYPLIVLEQSEEPAMLICISSIGSFESLYNCVFAIKQAGICSQTEIMLLDDGQIEEAVMLPLVVRGLRYSRLLPGEGLLGGYNRAILETETQYITFISAKILMQKDWLGEILATFIREPNCAVVGGKIVRADGKLHHIGVTVEDPGKGWLTDYGYLEASDSPSYNFLRPVVAFGCFALSVRRKWLKDCAGFDEGYGDASAASIDLCLRLSTKGYNILYQPIAELFWQSSGEGKDESLSMVCDPTSKDPPSEILRHTWMHTLPSFENIRPVGRALFLSDHFPIKDFETQFIVGQMRALLQFGYQVSFYGTSCCENLPIERALSGLGIEVCKPPFYNSIIECLEQIGSSLSLIQNSQSDGAMLLLEQMNKFAPQARTVLAPLDVEGLSELRSVAGYDLSLVRANSADGFREMLNPDSQHMLVTDTITPLNICARMLDVLDLPTRHSVIAL